MAAILKLSLLLVMNFIMYTAGTTVPRRSISPTDFVKSSCRATRYPVLCVQCLLGYANIIHQSDRQLAMTALSVSISRTRSSASFVKKVSKARGMKRREYIAMQDCIDNIGDSVDRLRESVRELSQMGGAVGKDFLWHMSNVQTWVSAALTDDNTCLDGFATTSMNGHVEDAIKNRVLHVAQVTSNALALVNRFASRHPTAP